MGEEPKVGPHTTQIHSGENLAGVQASPTARAVYRLPSVRSKMGQLPSRSDDGRIRVAGAQLGATEPYEADGYRL